MLQFAFFHSFTTITVSCDACTLFTSHKFLNQSTMFSRDTQKGTFLPSVELGVVAELVLLVGDIRSEVGDDVAKKSRSKRFPLDCALLWGKTNLFVCGDTEIVLVNIENNEMNMTSCSHLALFFW